ncbi:MAG: porin [Hydrogenophaga sp.]|uniref:porin n=1 Tax=Hydrogenophaga sp. TaxID=1904254 RepID=UPI0027377B0F|nr:porin [Hydrogenophaga sp.]MDP3107022.1 porin [Hydrogenophaga sp.]MDZ4294783.1 porin [Hydrogenophaga sp.]MDZ4399878.1 porin [Hydrogenophaga sp.]
MKKSLVALAVLGAFAGVASAQSSVSIYGIADVWVGSKDEGTGSVTRLDSGGLSTSRLGFKGTEDLGGGLSAIFGLEAGLSIDNGQSNSGGGLQFNRQSFVGFEGGFGQIIAGKVWTAYDDISAAAITSFDSAFSAEYFAFGSTNYSANPNNGFKYTSPDFGGISGAVSYALKETTGLKNTAFHLKYAGGPIYAGLAYQEETDAAVESKFTRVGASYDLGAIKLLANFGQLKKTGGEKTNDYSVGVDVPLGNALSIGAGYARGKDNAAAGGEKRDAFGVVATYNLSKRTTAYAGYTTGDGKTNGVKTSELDLYAVGIRHSF